MFTASLHGILFFFDFFWKYQLYSKGGQCLIPKSLFVVTVSSTDSSFKLTFFVRSYVCWNYILVAPFDGEREKGGGRRKGGTNWCLDSITIVSKIGWAKFTTPSIKQRKPTKNRKQTKKTELVKIHPNIKCSDKKLEFWRPLMFFGARDLGLILVLLHNVGPFAINVIHSKRFPEEKETAKMGFRSDNFYRTALAFCIFMRI